MSKKILIISGPTATGKTDLAIKLAKLYNGELISADSRQIYQGLNIGTGKDHSKDINIHLVDIITPDKSFSVAQFQKLAFQKISEIHKRKRLPIIVGGTGQYIDAIVNPNKATYSIKPNPFLRFFLNKFSVQTLQKIYCLLDKKSYLSLNNSEQHNPHRLIRKIEIKLSIPVEGRQGHLSTNLKKFNILHLSLTAPTSYLYPRIDSRVKKRLKIGLLNEIKNLLKTYKWSDTGLNTLAYKEFKNYYDNKKTLEKCIDKWRFDEHAYARRQLTWFKIQRKTIFINISKKNFEKIVFSRVKEWYNSL